MTTPTALGADKATDEPSFDTFRAWHRKAMGYSVLERDLPYAFDLYRASLAAVPASEPVAWMHDADGRVDVIHDQVKRLWLKVGQPNGFYREKVPCKVEHYTIPLYAAAPAPVSGMPDLAARLNEIDRHLAKCRFTERHEARRLVYTMLHDVCGTPVSKAPDTPVAPIICTYKSFAGHPPCAECAKAGRCIQAATLPAAPAPPRNTTFGLDDNGKQVLNNAATAPTEQAERAMERIEAAGFVYSPEWAASVSQGKAHPVAALPAEQAGELPPPAGTLHDDGYFVWPNKPHAASYAGWKVPFYTEDQMRAALAARQRKPSDEATRIASKQQTDPKLAGPGATAHERFLYEQLTRLQKAILAARQAPTAAPKAIHQVGFRDELNPPVIRWLDVAEKYISGLTPDVTRIVFDSAARQAPDSRDAALELAAKACAQQYTGLGGPIDDPHPDAVLVNGAINDCVKAIRALKGPAQ